MTSAKNSGPLPGRATSQVRRNPLRSPCKTDCLYDPARGVCVACLRTLDEITRWAAMDDVERLSVLRGLKERRSAQTENRDEAPARCGEGC